MQVYAPDVIEMIKGMSLLEAYNVYCSWMEENHTIFRHLEGLTDNRFNRFGNIYMGDNKICWGTARTSITEIEENNPATLFYSSVFNNDLGGTIAECASSIINVNKDIFSTIREGIETLGDYRPDTLLQDHLLPTDKPPSYFRASLFRTHDDKCAPIDSFSKGEALYFILWNLINKVGKDVEVGETRVSLTL